MVHAYLPRNLQATPLREAAGTFTQQTKIGRVCVHEAHSPSKVRSCPDGTYDTYTRGKEESQHLFFTYAAFINRNFHANWEELLFFPSVSCWKSERLFETKAKSCVVVIVTMKLSVALFFAGLFGALATLFILLSFGTDYWLLASETCKPHGVFTLEVGGGVFILRER